MLAAAFPRASWRTESEAIYAMQMSAAGIEPHVARRAITGLIATEMELPTVALVLRRCREVACEVEQREWQCPKCGSRLVAGSVGGPGVCFDCDWKGRFA